MDVIESIHTTVELETLVNDLTVEVSKFIRQRL